jgi:hypothetical protein
MSNDHPVIFELPARSSVTSPERLEELKLEIELNIYQICPKRLAERLLGEFDDRIPPRP